MEKGTMLVVGSVVTHFCEYTSVQQFCLCLVVEKISFLGSGAMLRLQLQKRQTRNVNVGSHKFFQDYTGSGIYILICFGRQWLFVTKLGCRGWWKEIADSVRLTPGKELKLASLWLIDPAQGRGWYKAELTSDKLCPLLSACIQEWEEINIMQL